MNVLTFLNMKGGVGKTTSSVNVAIGLASEGHNVLLIDLDPQANTTDQVLETTPANYIDVLFEGNGKIEYVPESTKYENLDLIPSRLELAKAERNLMINIESATHNKLKKVLRSIKKQYDFIIIDCAPILNLLTVNALVVSNQVIIPIKIDAGGEKGCNITVENINEIADNYSLEIETKILFTMYQRTKIENEKITAIQIAYPDYPFDQLIRNQPKPVTTAGYDTDALINTKANVANDYKKLVQEILHGHDVHVKKG